MTTTQADSHPATRTVTVKLRPRYDEQGEEMLWLASWIVDADGTEGEWFYSGTGTLGETFDPPADAIGVRIRRWPSRGMDPEFVDLDLGEAGLSIIDRGLAFDRPQRRNILATLTG